MISCTPFLKNRGIYTPTSKSTIESSPITSLLPKVTVFHQPSSTATNKSSSTTLTLLEITATQRPTHTATFSPSSTPTTTSEVEETQPVLSFIQKVYNPSEWKLLYQEPTDQIIFDSKEQMWIITGDQVGYFNEEDWVLYSEKDYGLPDSPFDMAIAPDGTIWLASQKAICQYRDGLWYVYTIPDAPDWSYPFLAIDSSNLVWLSLGLCYCENNLRTFDGLNWDKQTEPGEANQLLFTPDGTLWATFGRAIGQYNGKTWRIYSRTDLWSERDYFYNIRIASDNQGNIFGISASQEWIVKINRDGSITKIPFDFVHYEFIAELMRIFIDTQGRIWTNACRQDQNGLDYQNCFAYFQDNRWISFKDLPFWNWYDMNELSDGTLLIATNKGLFQYKPEN